MKSLRSFCLGLSLLLSACQAPQVTQAAGELSFAAAFPAEAGFRTQSLPASTRAIAIAVFSAEGPGGLEAGLVLTPALPSRRVGLLMPGPRRIVALAFDGEARPLNGARAEARIEAGKTSRAELDLQAGFAPSPEELALLRALLFRPQPGQSPLPIAPPSPLPSGGASTPSSALNPPAQPAATAAPEPAPTPAASPSPSGGSVRHSSGGGGGGSSTPGSNPTPSPSGGDLGAELSLEPGDGNLPPISATSAP